MLVAALYRWSPAAWIPELPEHTRRPTGVRVTRCKSWDDFIQALRFIAAKLDGRRIFRGHAYPDWKLSSTWERKLYSHHSMDGNFSRHEWYGGVDEYKRDRDKGLERFKDLAKVMPEIPLQMSDSDNDWWALGRHYGLETPLLDWSRSPFVAAFWAFAERMRFEQTRRDRQHSVLFDYQANQANQPVVVWELGYLDFNPIYSEVIKVFSKNEFDLIDNATYSLHRQRVQQGLFTRLEHEKYIDVESYLASKDLGAFLERYEIPCSTMDDLSVAMSDLERMNIHYGTVFPDPHGAAMQANMDPDWEMFRNEGEGGGETPLWGRAPVENS